LSTLPYWTFVAKHFSARQGEIATAHLPGWSAIAAAAV
jgi:hypothetical protein